MHSDDPTLTIARLSRLLETHGSPELSLPQYRVLGLLSGGEERATLLASRLSVAKPTLTAIVDGLVERGFVARETLDGDRRAVRVSITPAGREAFGRVAALLREPFDELLGLCADPAAVLQTMDQLRLALDHLWAARVQQPAAPSAADKQ